MVKNLFSKIGTYLNPSHPVSDELLEQLEKERGFVLPASYIQLLKIQNGGYLKKNLFIYDSDQDQRIETLAGIGKDRNGGMDLLVPEEHPVFAGEDLSLILPIGYYDYRYTALDYRRCGPKGAPVVVSLSVMEPPLIITQIADSFDIVLERLQRANDYYIFGLDGCPEDPTEVVTRLQKCLKARVEPWGSDERPAHRFWLESKVKKEYIELKPNVDYATHYDGEKVWSRPAGLGFDEFPEYKWLLCCYPDLSQINQRMKKIVKSGIALSLIHEPPLGLDAWVIHPKK